MKPGRFAYHAPTSVAEALEVLAEQAGEAKVMAGGQSLMPLLSFRMASPEHIVDINRLPDMAEPERTAAGWYFPALVRQRTVERSAVLAEELPLLRQALLQVAHPQIRNRGTVCGSLAHADPAAELPAVMTALGARMHVASTAGERTVAAEDFFVFHLTTALEPDELLVGVEVDALQPGTRTSFQEFATRHGDFGLASVAAVVTRADDGTVERCRLVASGVSATPQRLLAAEEAVVGTRLEPGALVAAERAVHREVSPTGDVHAPAEYRRQLVSVLARRALAEIQRDAGTEPAATNERGTEHAA
jgi:aerobic carbon-monoxide dehydrogenase medium subunit